MIKVALIPELKFRNSSNNSVVTIQYVSITDKLMQRTYEEYHELYARNGPSFKVAILIDVDYLLNEQHIITPALLEAVEYNVGRCIYSEGDMEFYIVDSLHNRKKGVTAIALRR